MADAYFLPDTEDGSGGRYSASAHTAGPWDPQLQHGGPPSALLIRAAERAAQAETGRSDLVALRYAADFVGPVPVGELLVSTQIVRAARSAVLVSATLEGLERPCLQARVWLVRDADTSAIAHAVTDTTVPTRGRGLGASFPYGDSIEWRAELGSLAERGPGTMWARPRMPLVAGERLGGLQRAALIGDSASGVSAELDWAEWSFLNVDLDVHLARPVRGEWIRMEAMTQLGPNGSALARSTLSDTAGVLGITAQTLILAPLRLPSA